MLEFALFKIEKKINQGDFNFIAKDYIIFKRINYLQNAKSILI